MVIGIGGVSRSGKSTLARQLYSEALRQGRSVHIIHQDEYVRSPEQLPLIRDHIDWEQPATLDWPRLEEAARTQIRQHDVVLLEGLFAFARAPLNACYDRCILMHIPEVLFRQRKRADLRWGREPEWYIAHIWQSFLQHGQPPAHLHPMTYIDGSVPVPLPIVRALLYA